MSNYQEIDDLYGEGGGKLDMLSAESSNADNLASLRASIAALHPYLVNRNQTQELEFEIWEVSSSGQILERSVCTLRQLVEKIRSLVNMGRSDLDKRHLR